MCWICVSRDRGRGGILVEPTDELNDDHVYTRAKHSAAYIGFRRESITRWSRTRDPVVNCVTTRNVVPLLKHDALKTYGEGGSIPPRCLNLGARFGLVVSFVPSPPAAVSQAKEPLGPFTRGWIVSRAAQDAVK
jgi:hypothetical protein